MDILEILTERLKIEQERLSSHQRELGSYKKNIEGLRQRLEEDERFCNGWIEAEKSQSIYVDYLKCEIARLTPPSEVHQMD